MVGNKHRKVIDSWISSTIDNGGIDRLDDLHLDQIDSAWDAKETWVSSALESFETAVKIRDKYEQASALTVLLSFPLISGGERLGAAFHSKKELEEQLSYIPPSLYLLHSDHKLVRLAAAQEHGRIRSDGDVKVLSDMMFLANARVSARVLYSERWSPDDDEFSRYLYLLG